MTQSYRPPSALLSFTITFIGMLAFLQVYSIQSILPLLAKDYHATEVQLGLAVGASVFGMALTSPFIGMISDAFGRRWLIRSALALVTIPIILTAFSTNIHILTALRFVQGFFVPGMTVCLIAYLGEEFADEHTGKLTSYYVMGTVCGGFFGRFILGHLSEHMTWQNAMLIMASLNFLGFLLVLWQLPASLNFKPKPNLSVAFDTLKNHLKNRTVLSACALGFCVLFSLVGCFSFINLHLAKPPYHLHSGQLANLFVVYLLGMVITPGAAWLLKRFGADRTMTFSVCLSALGVIITSADSLTIIIIGLAFMCTGVFITQSATISHIALHIREGRSLATGLYYMSYYLGGTVGSWICALSYKHGKWLAVVTTLLILQIIAISIIVRFISRQTQTRHIN